MATGKVYFKWMGAYWVCSEATWDKCLGARDIFTFIELNDQIIQLTDVTSIPVGQLRDLYR